MPTERLFKCRRIVTAATVVITLATVNVATAHGEDVRASIISACCTVCNDGDQVRSMIVLFPVLQLPSGEFFRWVGLAFSSLLYVTRVV
jgi:hypothetical protein